MSQPPAQPDEPLDLIVCPECDAAVPTGHRFCWLCGHQMDSPFKRGSATTATATTASSPPGKAPAPSDPARDLVLNVSLAGAAIVLVLITVAVWVQEPLYGIALAFVLVPALSITLISGLVSRLSGRTMTPARRLLVFVKSTVAMFVVATVTAAIGVIVAAVVIIGLIVALFETCFKLLGGG